MKIILKNKFETKGRKNPPKTEAIRRAGKSRFEELLKKANC